MDNQYWSTAFVIHHQGELMSFSVESFVETPTSSSLKTLKMSDLLALANHYKLETTSGMTNLNSYQVYNC